MRNNQLVQHSQVIEALKKNPRLRFDKRWRMDNLYHITTKSGDRVVFKMNKAQRHFFENYLIKKTPYHRHIILKSRQLGFTTFINLWILDEILFTPNREALTIAHTNGDAQDIFDRKVDYALRNMPTELKEALFKVNKQSAKKLQIVTDWGKNKGSKSTFSVSTSGRSGTYNYVHVSELAKLSAMYPNRAKEVVQGTIPAIPSGGYLFIESTAEGATGKFYDMFQNAWQRKDTITPTSSKVRVFPHFYNWQWDVDTIEETVDEIIPIEKMERCMDIDWQSYKDEFELTDKELTFYYLKWLQSDGDIDTLRQEYPTTPEEAFVASGLPYFPSRIVTEGIQHNRTVASESGFLADEDDKVEFIPESSGEFVIYKKPEKGIPYVIGGDTSEGLAHGDKQVLAVLNSKTWDIDALFVSDCSADEMADKAIRLARYYNRALLGIESNRDGRWINETIYDKGYHNLYTRQVTDDVTKKKTKFYGWLTTRDKRDYALTSLKVRLLKKGYEGLPVPLLEEMLSFVRNKKGKPEAMEGKHDDIIMGTAIAYGILKENGGVVKNEESPEAISVADVIWG